MCLGGRFTCLGRFLLSMLNIPVAVRQGVVMKSRSIVALVSAILVRRGHISIPGKRCSSTDVVYSRHSMFGICALPEILSGFDDMDVNDEADVWCYVPRRIARSLGTAI